MPASTSRSPHGSGLRCCSQISPKPLPKAAAKRKPRICAAPNPTRSQARRRRAATYGSRPVDGASQRRRRASRRRRADSRRRRRHQRRRDGGRVGDHRRIGAGHSRIGRRPQRRNGRHARAFRSDRRSRYGESRRDVSRPHDLARRRRAASKDAERDRAFDPARRA